MKKLFLLLLSLLISIPANANLQHAIDLFFNADYTNSFEEFKVLAGSGDPVGQAYLSWHYFDGYGTELNTSLGEKWEEKSFNALKALSTRTPEQQWILAYYLASVDSEQSAAMYQKSFNGFSKLAKSGDAYAAFTLSDFYYTGNGGIEVNSKKEDKWLFIAAEKGYAPAQIYYGWRLIDYGDLKETDHESIEWFQKAAQQGNRDAKEELNKLYVECQEKVSSTLFPSLSETLTIDDIVGRNDLFYKKYTKVPFTGWISGEQKGEFKDGKRIGEWFVYHMNGQVYRKKNYKAGKLDGYWEECNDSGQLIAKENYKAGKKDGLWERYDRYGWLEEKGNYKAGKKDGFWERYYKFCGRLEEKGNYKAGKKDGLWERYDKYGGWLEEKGNYIAGKKDGLWERYSSLDGKLIEKANYKDGERDVW